MMLSFRTPQSRIVVITLIVVVFVVTTTFLLIIDDHNVASRRQQQQQIRISSWTNNHNNHIYRHSRGLFGNVVEKIVDSVLLTTNKDADGNFQEATDVSAVIIRENSNGREKTTTNKSNNKLNELHELIEKYKVDKEKRKFGDKTKQLTAVLHVGPMKTGSTAIQQMMRLSKDVLLLDNYEYGNALFPGYPNTFFMCFDEESLLTDLDNPCSIDALKQITQQVAINGQHNVILSSEGFWRIELNLNALKDYITYSGWDNIMVVMYYRRYYDWLLSFFNQGNKSKDVTERKSIVSKLEHTMKNNDIDSWSPQYVVGEYNRYSDTFGPENIKLYNMHTIPNGDVREALVCDAMQSNSNNKNEQQHTCEALRELQKTNVEHKNVHGSLIYDSLAYYALEMKLWKKSSKLSFDDVVELVQNRQEKILNLTEYDFSIGRTCPSDIVYDWLLNMSLQAEEILFPDYYKQQGRDEIIDHYNKSKNKFCDYDAQAVLLDDGPEAQAWRTFFQSL